MYIESTNDSLEKELSAYVHTNSGSSPISNKEHYQNDIDQQQQQQQDLPLVNAKIEEILDHEDESEDQIEYLTAHEPEPEQQQTESSFVDIINSERNPIDIDTSVAIIQQSDIQTEDDENDCNVCTEESIIEQVQIKDTHLNEEEMIYENSLHDTPLNEPYFNSDAINRRSSDCRSGHSKFETHFVNTNSTSSEIVKLQKNLMMREFEMLQERHSIEMEILKNELEFKKIEHLKKLKYMDKKLGEQ